MSKVTLYGFDMSPYVRSCFLTLNALDLPFEYKFVDLFKGEQNSEEFRKHNPQQTVPVLEDNGFWIYDSHAIIAYLVDKYGKNDSLYPKDLQKRAIVNQRLFFEATVITIALRNMVLPFFKNGVTTISKESTEDAIVAYEHLENFLVDRTYLAGEHLTIADFCTVTMISSIDGLVPIDAEKFPKVAAWIALLEKLPYYEKCNGKNKRDHIAFLRSKFTKIEI